MNIKTHKLVFVGTVSELRQWLKTWPITVPLSLYLTHFVPHYHHPNKDGYTGRPT